MSLLQEYVRLADHHLALKLDQKEGPQHRVESWRHCYSGPEKLLRWRSATRTANTAASVRCFIPIFMRRFET